MSHPRAMAAALALASLLTCAVGFAERKAAASCRWDEVAIPAALGELSLQALAAVGAADVWIVGTEYPGYPAPSQPVLLHWEGHKLVRTRLAIPNAALNAVDGASSSDVWAVGWNNSVGGNLALHWNGSHWRRVGTPNDRRSKNNALQDVAAVSKKEAWAVGRVYATSPAGSEGEWPIIQRWNGRRWAIVGSPLKGQGVLEAVAGKSKREIWTVGWSRPKSPHALGVRPLALRWNGSRWISARLPRTRYISGRLDDVAVTGKESWAVGATDTAPDRGELGKGEAYTLHLVAGRWRPASRPADRSQRYSGLVAHEPTNAWAWSDTYIGHWDGKHWAPGPRIDFATETDAQIVALEVTQDHVLWLLGNYWEAESKTTRQVLARRVCS
jgi:hypothetical protein